MTTNTRVSGFNRLGLLERLHLLEERGVLLRPQTDELLRAVQPTVDATESMIENAIGAWPLPLGVAMNFVVNHKGYFVPMAIEEPSVVAAASLGAKIALGAGGFTAEADPPRTIGQIELRDAPDAAQAVRTLHERSDEIVQAANRASPRLVARGGGATEIGARVLDDRPGHLVLDVFVDCRDAMGANLVNSMVEAIAPHVAAMVGAKPGLQILSNLAVRRMARARATFPASALGTETLKGEEVAEAIAEAYWFAEADPYRAVTHNKGIMNGVDAVALACGNDWRSIEAAAHAYAGRSGRYRPLSHYAVSAAGDLLADIEMPVPVGIVGGAARAHPIARIALALLGVDSAVELAQVLCAVGLAQNFAALRALATDGIQRGHMALHARSVAFSAGARGDEVERVAGILVSLGDYRIENARQVLQALADRVAMPLEIEASEAEAE